MKLDWGSGLESTVPTMRALHPARSMHTLHTMRAMHVTDRVQTMHTVRTVHKCTPPQTLHTACLKEDGPPAAFEPATPKPQRESGNDRPPALVHSDARGTCRQRN